MSIYTFANVINSAIPFLLLPILTRYLSQEEFGIYSNYHTISRFCIPLIGLNVASAFTRHYYGDDFKISSYMSTAVMLTLISGVLCLGGLYGLAEVIESYTGVPSEYYWMIVGWIIANNLGELIMNYWRVRNQALWFGVFRIGRSLFEFGFTILFVIYFDHGWVGRAEGQIWAYAVSGVLALILLRYRTQILPKINKEDLRRILRYGAPLIPHVLGAVVIMQSDQIFVTRMVGLDFNGVYSAAFQVGMVIALVSTSFNQAWVPWFYENLRKGTDQVKRQIVKYSYVYMIFVLGLLGVLILASPLLFKILGERFQGGYDYLLWILLGLTCNALYKIFVNYLFYWERTGIIAVIAILTVIMNLVLNYFLILEYSTIGAAYATAISMLFQLIVTAAVAIRLGDMPWLKR